MADDTPGSGSKASAKKLTPTTITDARSGTSREMASREKRYAITMGIRTACFVTMIFVSGPLRWVFLAAAVFLPYIAVVLANQANTRTPPASLVEQGEATSAPQLTVGPPPVEVIDGELVDEERAHEERDNEEPADHHGPGATNPGGPDHDGDDRWTQHDRVA